MNDYALCANYERDKCPTSCFRAQITERTQQRANESGETIICTFTCFEGTSECELKGEREMTENESTIQRLKGLCNDLNSAVKAMEYVDAQRRYIDRLKRKYEDCRSVLCSVCPKSHCDGCKYKTLDDEDLMTATMLSEV